MKLPDPAGCIEPKPDVESVNRSLGRDFIEYIRILNRRQAASQPVFAREDVLETALRVEPRSEAADGIAAWLSPAARRELLAAYAEGNDAIARDFLGSGRTGCSRKARPTAT